MKKMNNEGFTLVEIIAVIVLLGILLAIAIPAINNQLATFRLNYYSKLEASVKSAGEDYTVDKRYSKPTKLLYSKVIKVEDLEDGYIDEVTDYLGNKCDNTDTSYSYVVAVKVGDDEYDYTACLRCSEDEYYTDTSGEESDYCNSGWLTNENISYEISYDDSDLYVYYGTTEEEIKPQVALTYKVIKYDSSGNVLKEVNDSEDAIYPDNIGELVGKSINSTINLVYTLPDGTTLTKKATIYKHNAPSVTLTYNAANNLTGKSIGNTYTSGEWASSVKAVITFSSSDNSNVISDIGMKTVQYYNGTSWVNTNCTVSNNKCTWTISSNFESSIKFRIVNNNNMTSDESSSYTIQVDVDSPVCSITSTNDLKSTAQTATFTCSDSYSGLSKYYFGTSSSTSPSTSISGNLSKTSSISSSGTRYLEAYDKAGNLASTSKTWYSYVVKTMVQKTDGTAGTYNTTNYDTYSTSSTYIALKGKSLTSSSLYTTPTGSAYQGYSIGLPSTTATTITTSGNASLTGDITVAYWFDRATYTLTYDSQNGSSCSSVSKLYGDTWGTLCTPTRTGYTFNGWYTETGGSGTEVTDSTTATGNQTVYAYWTGISYTISYTLNSGSYGTNHPTSAVYGNTITIDNPTRAGYTFAGWTASNLNTSTAKYGTSSASTSWSSGSTKVTGTKFKNLRSTSGDVALTANWTAKTYTVTFNANGGSVSTSSTSVTYGSTYGDLPTPTYSGYTFAGWYTTASGGTRITSTSTVSITSNTTLYAHWTANTYTVTFNVNGGYSWAYMAGKYCTDNGGTYNSSALTCTKDVTYGSTYGTIPTAVSASTFAGWYTSSSGGTKIKSSSTVSITSDTTLYAHWIGVTCTKGSTWSSSSGTLTAKATSVGSSISTLYYKKLSATSYSSVSSASKEISGAYYTWYVYAKDSDGNTSSVKTCYASYDNLKPYTPYISSANASSSNASASMTSSCSVTNATSDMSCTITVTYTGSSSGGVSWTVSGGDQSSTDESGCSGYSYRTADKTYSDGSTCSETMGDGTCPTTGLSKIVYYSYDYAGNKSSKLTLYIKYVKS